MFYNKFFEHLKKTKLACLADSFQKTSDDILKNSNNGNLPRWIEGYKSLPHIEDAKNIFNNKIVSIGDKDKASDESSKKLKELFRTLRPWKKGPYSVFGMDIDAEWCSDIKWDRLKGHISSLKNKAVLDVGCANGYHCFRMLEDDPKVVVGVDPSLKYVMQFLFLNKYANINNMAVLPLGIDDVPSNCESFDTVFSMGLLYHRRSPFCIYLSSY
jgi:tRNA (mo5U34)-methyltransferase